MTMRRGIEVDSSIEVVLLKYEKGFEEPKELPLRRIIRLIFREGALPVTMKPYRYPFY